MKKLGLRLIALLVLLGEYTTLLADNNSVKIDFLALSDVHVGNNQYYPEMQAKTYLLPQIKKYIEKYNVRTFLMPGDLTTSGDIKTLAADSLDLFLNRWYKPLSSYLWVIPGNQVLQSLLITCGNHDFDARSWPHYPKIIQFIHSTYAGFNPVWWQDYRYAVEIYGVLFVSLGYGPRGSSLARSVISYWGPTLPATGTNEWIERYLKNISKIKPIILFFHVPVAGPNFQFMKKKDMEKFYNIIKGYNIKAIIVGHTHGNSSLNFKGFWQIDVSGTKFLHASYDPNTDTLVGEFVDKDGNTESISMPQNPDDYDYDKTEDYVDF